MPRQPKPPQAAEARFAVVVTPALLAACRVAAKSSGESLSNWLRRVTATAAGRPDLAQTQPRGKPKTKAA